jgi:hypothetical protein
LAANMPPSPEDRDSHRQLSPGANNSANRRVNPSTTGFHQFSASSTSTNTNSRRLNSSGDSKGELYSYNHMDSNSSSPEAERLVLRQRQQATEWEELVAATTAASTILNSRSRSYSQDQHQNDTSRCSSFVSPVISSTMRSPLSNSTRSSSSPHALDWTTEMTANMDHEKYSSHEHTRDSSNNDDDDDREVDGISVDSAQFVARP